MVSLIVVVRNEVGYIEGVLESFAQQEYPSTSPDTPVEQVLPLVAEGNLPVAVLDEERRLLGVVTRSALIEAMQLGNGNNNGN